MVHTMRCRGTSKATRSSSAGTTQDRTARHPWVQTIRQPPPARPRNTTHPAEAQRCSRNDRGHLIAHSECDRSDAGVRRTGEYNGAALGAPDDLATLELLHHPAVGVDEFAGRRVAENAVLGCGFQPGCADGTLGHLGAGPRRPDDRSSAERLRCAAGPVTSSETGAPRDPGVPSPPSHLARMAPTRACAPPVEVQGNGFTLVLLEGDAGDACLQHRRVSESALLVAELAVGRADRTPRDLRAGRRRIDHKTALILPVRAALLQAGPDRAQCRAEVVTGGDSADLLV
ncbi:hypothetical protein QFZ23_002207 [Arthrobacter globiformis]|nr:hypothetical protein [Arthrobacter globiformis]